MAWMIAAPPATGFVLLLPITSQARPAGSAIAQNMQIVATAPFGGVVAHAGSDRNDAALLRQGVVVLAAPRSWCGGDAA